MDTKANYVAVGLFTLLAFLAMFGMLFWAYGVDNTGDTATLRIRIPGSASGLGRGSAVLFNGIKVGDVQRVYIDVNNPTDAIADTRIDRLTPITESTRADIGIAGLTGQANIELKGGDPNERNLLEQADAEGTVAQITANPSAVTDLLQTAQDIFTRADRAVSNLEGFIDEVRGPLQNTVGNVETFSRSLADNAEGVNQFLANFGELSQTLGTVSGRLDTTLAATEELIRSVDREQVGAIVTNVETFTGRLQSASANLDRIMANVDETATSVRTFAENANGTLARADGILAEVKTGVDQAVSSFAGISEQASGTLSKVDVVLDSAKGGIDTAANSITSLATDASSALEKADGILASIDPARVESALASIEGAAGDARKAAGDVSVVTERFSARADDIEQIITNTRGVTDTLAQASARVDGLMSKADGVLDSARSGIDTAAGSITGLATDASGTLSRADEILASVDPAKVDSALTSFESAARDASKAAGDVSVVTERFRNRAEDIEQIIANTRSVTDTLAAASTRVDGLIKKVDTVLADVDTETVNRAINDFSGAAADARKAAGDVAAFTDGIGARKEDVDAIISDARLMAENLRQASTRVEGVLVKVDDLLGSGETESLFTDASATLQSFRSVADTLNARLGTILDNLSRFSGQGLRDVETLIRDSRRSINRIEEAVSEFERNPQRIITGGEGGVRQYDGRVRR